MSTRLEALAEDDDRRVGDDRRAARAVAQRRRRVAPARSSRARRVSWISRRGARRSISFARPGVPCDPNHIEALDVEREPRVEGLQPPLGPELEERVGLQARLLGLAELAGAGGGLHAVQRDRDEVVVGLVGRRLPRVGHRGPQGVLGRARERLDVAGVGDALLALGGLVDDRARGGRGRARPRRCARGRAWPAGRAGRRTRSARRCGRRPPPGPRSRASPAGRGRRARTRRARARGSAAAAGRGARPPRA